MGFPIPVRWHLYIESGPWWHCPLMQLEDFTTKNSIVIFIAWCTDVKYRPLLWLSIAVCTSKLRLVIAILLNDPHFQEKVSPSLPVHKTTCSSNCSDKTEFQTTIWCLQTKAPDGSCVFVLRWGRYSISKAYQVKYQALWKWPAKDACSCELISLSLHARTDRQAVLAQSHRSPSANPISKIDSLLQYYLN